MSKDQTTPMWKEEDSETRYPHGLVTELATGENPPGVKFQLLIEIGSGNLFVKREGKTYSCTLRRICDSFFEQVLK